MTTKRWVPGALIPSNFETIALANGTSVAVGLNSTSRQCDAFHISVETNDVRYRFDSTAPTATTGILVQKDTDFWFKGLRQSDLANLKFISSTGTGLIQVMAYKYLGT